MEGHQKWEIQAEYFVKVFSFNPSVTEILPYDKAYSAQVRIMCPCHQLYNAY